MPQRLLRWFSGSWWSALLEVYYGATDSVLCTAEFQITEAALVALGTARQNHQVPKCYSKKISLNIGRLPTLRRSPFDSVRSANDLAPRPDVPSKRASLIEALDVTRVSTERFPEFPHRCNLHLAFALWQLVIVLCRSRPRQETQTPVRAYSCPLRYAEIRSVQ
jgi:hypothetical protein